MRGHLLGRGTLTGCARFSGPGKGLPEAPKRSEPGLGLEQLIAAKVIGSAADQQKDLPAIHPPVISPADAHHLREAIPGHRVSARFVGLSNSGSASLFGRYCLVAG